MARKTKKEVVAELKAKGVEFDEKANYRDLCKLLKGAGKPEPEKKPAQIKLVSKIPKRNTFLSDSVRDERDAEVLRREVGKREHKGKIKTITTTKQMEVSKDGFWVTEFVIDLKG